MKKNRRARGYTKSDTPDKIKQSISKSRQYINEMKKQRPVNYLINEFQNAKRNSIKKNSLQWISRGPGNVGGRTRSVIVDQSDSTFSTWFSASVGGGIWKTIDKGLMWENLTDGQIPTLAFSTIAQSKSNPKHIICRIG